MLAPTLVAVPLHQGRLPGNDACGGPFQVREPELYRLSSHAIRRSRHVGLQSSQVGVGNGVHHALHGLHVRSHPGLVRGQLQDALQGPLLRHERALDVSTGMPVLIGQVRRRGLIHLLLGDDELVPQAPGPVAGDLPRQADGHVIICAGHGVGRRRPYDHHPLELGGISLVGPVPGGVVPLIRPHDHHDPGDLHPPVVEDHVVRGPVMGLDAVIERLVGPRRGHDASRHLVEPAPVLDPLVVGLPHEPVEVLHDVVDVVGVAVGGAHETHVGLVHGQPLAHHVHVDVGQRLLHELLVLPHPWARPGELGAPEEADGAPGPWDPAFLDERVQRPSHLQDGTASGVIVVGTLLHVPLEEVGREDDLVRVGVRSGDVGHRILELIGLVGGFHLGVNHDLLTGQQTALEHLRFPWGDEESELRVAPTPGPHPAPWDLEGIEEGPAVGDVHHPQGTPLHAGRLVNPTHGTLRHHNLPGHAGPVQLIRRPHPHPYQGSRHVGIPAPAGQHGPEVLVGGQLLTHGAHLPQLSLDPVPHLSTREAHDLGSGDSVQLQLVVDVLSLVEGVGVLLRVAELVVTSQLHHGVPGRLTGGFADDLVHDGRLQERPVVPRGVLGVGGTRQHQQRRDEGEEGVEGTSHHDKSPRIWTLAPGLRTQKPCGEPAD